MVAVFGWTAGAAPSFVCMAPVIATTGMTATTEIERATAIATTGMIVVAAAQPGTEGSQW